MFDLTKLNKQVSKIVAKLNEQDLPNEVKKRTAVAKVNEWANKQGVEISDYTEIEKQIEMEVHN